MKYEKSYNRVHNEWWIFCVGTRGAQLVKVCKTEKSADNWIAKH